MVNGEDAQLEALCAGPSRKYLVHLRRRVGEGVGTKNSQSVCLACTNAHGIDTP